MEPQLYETGLPQEALAPTPLPWICSVTAAWIMSRSSWVRTMFVSQVGPSHWAWADPIERPKKIGINALISVDIVILLSALASPTPKAGATTRNWPLGEATCRQDMTDTLFLLEKR